MKITYYDSPEINIVENYMACFMVQPSLILADTFTISLDDSWGKLVMEDIDTWSHEKIYTSFKEVFPADKNALGMIKEYNQMRQAIKNLKALRNKHKELSRITHMFNSISNGFKIYLEFHRDEVIQEHKIQECLPFAQDGVFIMKSIDFKQMDNKEHVLIPEITKVLINRLEIMAFHESVEKMFSHVNYNEIESNEFDFIRIPLWEIPVLDELAYKQLKYTRNDLHPAMAPFKIKLQEFWDEIVTIQFIDENIEQLKHLCQTKLYPFVQPIQHAIDESLYISQIKNKSQNNNKLTMCMGITSADRLIQYYEKVETVLPYVASEIKQQVSRYMDLKATQMFVYFKVHTIT